MENNFTKQTTIEKSCWELKIELESLKDYDFEVEIVYGNIKKNQKNSCIFYSGHKNKKLDFVYGNYNENGEYYIPELEEIIEDIELEELPKEEILKHYYKVKEILDA